MMPEIGDWIRFQHAGTLKISIVEYVTDVKSWPYTKQIHTLEAVVHEENILEIRKPNK